MKIDARSLVRAWRLVRAAGVELFAPDASRELPRVKGWDACGLPSEDVAQSPAVTVLAALRAIELHHSEQPTDVARATLVATLPGRGRDVAATRDVVRELLRSARRGARTPVHHRPCDAVVLGPVPCVWDAVSLATSHHVWQAVLREQNVGCHQREHSSIAKSPRGRLMGTAGVCGRPVLLTQNGLPHMV